MTNSSQTNAGTVSAATTTVAHNRSNAALAPAEKPAKFSGVDFEMAAKDVLLSHHIESAEVH